MSGAASRPEVLVVLKDDTFALPDGALPELPGGLGSQDSLAPLCRAVVRLCGAPSTLTHRVISGDQSVNVLRCDRAAALGAWRPLDELDEHVGSDLAEAVRTSAGPPWVRVAYQARLLDFARSRLAELGRGPVGEPEQVRISPLSCIYRLPSGSWAESGGDAPTSSGFWIKATRPGAFAPEAEIMSALAEAFPELVPAPLACDGAWMLSADFGNRLPAGAGAAVLGPALADFAALQLGADGLLETPGLQSWRLADLPADLEESRAVLGDGRDALLERVAVDVVELLALGIGDHLVHGDLYWGNMARANGRVRFFDWSDAGVSHPFFDPMDAFMIGDAARRAPLERAYLDVWRARTDADVAAAWDLARRLAPAHHLARNTRLIGCLDPFERATCEPNRRWFADKLREAYEIG